MFDEKLREGYLTAIEDLEDISNRELGASDIDIYCSETISDFIKIMLDRLKEE